MVISRLSTCVPESPLQLEAVLLSRPLWLLWLVDCELTELLEVSYVSLAGRPYEIDNFSTQFCVQILLMNNV